MARLGLSNPSHILPDLAIRQEQRGKLFNPRYQVTFKKDKKNALRVTSPRGVLVCGKSPI
jgi:hypothetical protein